MSKPTILWCVQEWNDDDLSGFIESIWTNEHDAAARASEMSERAYVKPFAIDANWGAIYAQQFV